LQREGRVNLALPAYGPTTTPAMNMDTPRTDLALASLRPASLQGGPASSETFRDHSRPASPKVAERVNGGAPSISHTINA
jgi:hypothetical protein